jgi:hydrogenase expression/formation protein HypC
VCLAVPGRLAAIVTEDGLCMGIVDFGGVRRKVCLEGVLEARVDDWLLVHVGFALRVLDPASAELSEQILVGHREQEGGTA